MEMYMSEGSKAATACSRSRSRSFLERVAECAAATTVGVAPSNPSRPFTSPGMSL